MRQKLVVSWDTSASSSIMADEEHSIFIRLRIRQRRFQL